MFLRRTRETAPGTHESTMITGIPDGGSLYEFTTDDGFHVSLHEARCRQITVNPMELSLKIVFDLDRRPRTRPLGS